MWARPQRRESSTRRTLASGRAPVRQHPSSGATGTPAKDAGFWQGRRLFLLTGNTPRMAVDQGRAVVIPDSVFRAPAERVERNGSIQNLLGVRALLDMFRMAG
jgi:hypothetical protein